LRLKLLLFLLIYAALGSLMVIQYLHCWNDSLESLQFGFGPLIRSIMRTNEYKVTCPDGISFTAHRLPFIPYFLAAVGSLIRDNVAVAMIVKNLLFVPLLGYPIALALKGSRLPVLFYLLMFLSVLSMPQLVLHTFHVTCEEPFIVPLLAVMSGILYFGPLHDRDKRRYWPHALFALCNLILFLTKSSMTCICIVLAFLPFLAFSRRGLLVLNVVALLAGMLAWAGFNYHNSGHFTISSSLNGSHFHKGNNRYALEYYPRRSLDLLPPLGEEGEHPRAEIKDEWDLYKYHRAKALEFIREHSSSFARLTWRRFFAFFIEVRPYGSTDPSGEIHRPFKYLGMAYMVFFRLLFLSSIVSSCCILLARDAALSRPAWCYLLMVAFYAAPCVLGYAYERHVVPLVMPTALYVMYLVRYRAGDLSASAQVI
jgi:hypothetical protein